MGIFSFLEKLIDKIPIQGRTERWKNEIDLLTAEKNELLRGPANEKKSMRLRVIDKRITELYQLCKNKVEA